MQDNNVRLPFTELSAGGKIYMLRLTALSAVRLEERLGMSVYKALERTDEVKIIAELLFALIESFKPEFSRQETYAVIDDYISEGNTLASLNNLIAEALKNSGFFAPAPAA